MQLNIFSILKILYIFKPKSYMAKSLYFFNNYNNLLNKHMIVIVLYFIGIIVKNNFHIDISILD